MDVISLFDGKSLADNFRIKGYPEWEFYATEHWFLPCIVYEYTVLIEIKDAKALNMFEEAVLQLIELNQRAPEEFSDLLCVDSALINLILSDLESKGYITSLSKITELGKSKLKDQRTHAKSYEKLELSLFANAETGKLLPTFLPRNNQNLRHTDAIREGGKLTFYHGTQGKKRYTTGRIIPTKQNNLHPPSQDEVETLLRQVEKWQRNSGEVGNLPKFNYGYVSPLIKREELCYFHLQAGIDKGSAHDIVISDGILPNLQSMVSFVQGEGGSQEKRDRMVEELRSKGAMQCERLALAPKSVNRRYPNLLGEWRTPLSEFAVTQNDRDKRTADIIKIIGELYGELEWGLHYYYEKNPLSYETLDPFSTRNSNGNKRELELILTDAQILAPKKKQGFIEKCDGKWIHKEVTEPSMAIYFPYLLIEWQRDKNEKSAEALEKTPLAQMREKIPTFYKDLIEITKWRNNANHGGGETPPFTRVKHYQEMAKTFLSILLEDWDTEMIEGSNQIDQDSADNAYLKQIITVDQEFGARNHYRFSKEMKQNLYILFYDENQPHPSNRSYILALSIILEIIFEEILTEQAEFCGTPLTSYKTTIEIEKLKTQLLTKIRQDIQSKQETTFELPLAISTVNSHQIIKALKFGGKGATLGAKVLAFLAQSKPALVEEFLAQDGLSLVAEICTYRGHGGTEHREILEKHRGELQGKIEPYPKSMEEQIDPSCDFLTLNDIKELYLNRVTKLIKLFLEQLS